MPKLTEKKKKIKFSGPKVEFKESINDSKPNQLDLDSEILPEDNTQISKRISTSDLGIGPKNTLGSYPGFSSKLIETRTGGIKYQSVKILEKKIDQLKHTLSEEYDSEKLTKICDIVMKKVMPKQKIDSSQIKGLIESVQIHASDNEGNSPSFGDHRAKFGRAHSLMSIDSSLGAKRSQNAEYSDYRHSQNTETLKDGVFTQSNSEYVDEKRSISMIRLCILNFPTRLVYRRLSFLFVSLMLCIIMMKIIFGSLLLANVNNLMDYQQRINQISNILQPTGYFYKGCALYRNALYTNYSVANFANRSVYQSTHLLFHYDLIARQYDVLSYAFSSTDTVVNNTYLSKIASPDNLGISSVFNVYSSMIVDLWQALFVPNFAFTPVFPRFRVIFTAQEMSRVLFLVLYDDFESENLSANVYEDSLGGYYTGYFCIDIVGEVLIGNGFFTSYCSTCHSPYGLQREEKHC
jgi:hypothetical protein